MVTSSEQPSQVPSSEEIVEGTVPTEDPAMEAGIDSSELFVNQSVQSLTVVHNEKTWNFTYKDLSWAEKYKCVDAAQVWSEGEFQFSLSSYYTSALIEMIQDAPVKPFTETTLSRLDTSVVAQLLQIVPPPADPEVPDAVKKVSGRGEIG